MILVAHGAVETRLRRLVRVEDGIVDALLHFTLPVSEWREKLPLPR
jgi:hypothetical protein